MALRTACALFVGLCAVLPPTLRLLFVQKFPVAKGAVIVTGASTGIGLHAAAALASHGYTVYATVRKDADARRLQAELPKLRPLIMDVVNEDQVQEAKAIVSKELDQEGIKLVGLVNNAGLSRRMPMEFEILEEVIDLFQVNVFGVMRVTQAFLPMLRASGAGRVVNVGSISARAPNVGSSAYSASKTALEAISHSLRQEVAHWNISVSLIEPAYVKTDLPGKQLGENAPWNRISNREEFDKIWGWWPPVQEAARVRADAIAATPDVTTEAILHAMESEYPETLYYVANAFGIPCRAVAWLAWLLPDRVADQLQAKIAARAAASAAR